MLKILKHMKQIINFKSMSIMFKIFLRNELMFFGEVSISILSTRIFFAFLIVSFKERHAVHITLSNKIMLVETITILYFVFKKIVSFLFQLFFITTYLTGA